MKTLKRKAKRIIDRPIKKKVLMKTNHRKSITNNNQDVYAGNEKAMIDLVVKIIVKTIKKSIDL